MSFRESMTRAEAAEILETLDTALARFMRDADRDNDGDDQWNLELRFLVSRCDAVSQLIEQARPHFEDDYRLIEIAVKSTHNVWVKGGTENQAHAAATDYLMQHLTMECGGNEHLAAWVEDYETLETRAGRYWEPEQTADIEI